MKKIVRLTEGQLHRLIEQTINELDDRTYAHAAQLANLETRYYDGPFSNFETPMGKAIANVEKPRRERQRDAFLAKLNQNVNKKLRLPSDTQIFHKDNIMDRHHEDFKNPPPLNPATPRGKYERQIHNFMQGNAYYDETLGKWVDKNDPEYDIDKMKRFRHKSEHNHIPLAYESVVHNIAENVIHKLRRV